MLLWLKFFNYLRLFDQFAAFIRMTTEIIKDSITFTAMLGIVFGAFANAFLILSVNQEKDQNKEHMYAHQFGVDSVDAFFGQYELALGEFYLDTMENKPFALALFCLATFIS